MASKSSSRTLTDHDEIQRWAQERGAKPSVVRNTERDDSIGIIRLDFPGYSGEGSLEEIGWDEWFEDFDDNNLALIVQDQAANGQKSNFNKLVSRESVEEGSGRGRTQKTSARGRSQSRSQSNGGSQSRSRSKSEGRSKTAQGSGRAKKTAKTAASSSRKNGAKAVGHGKKRSQTQNQKPRRRAA